jgi:hypothetical protein
MRVAPQRPLHLQRQPIHALAHVGSANRQPHPNPRSEPRSSPRERRNDGSRQGGRNRNRDSHSGVLRELDRDCRAQPVRRRHRQPAPRAPERSRSPPLADPGASGRSDSASRWPDAERPAPPHQARTPPQSPASARRSTGARRPEARPRRRSIKPSAPSTSYRSRSRRKCRSLIPNSSAASTQLNRPPRYRSNVSRDRAIRTSGRIPIPRFGTPPKPDRSSAAKSGHFICYGHSSLLSCCGRVGTEVISSFRHHFSSSAVHYEHSGYAADVVIKADHWWYGGRRLLFSDLIKAFGLPEKRGHPRLRYHGCVKNQTMGVAVAGIRGMPAQRAGRRDISV